MSDPENIPEFNPDIRGLTHFVRSEVHYKSSVHLAEDAEIMRHAGDLLLLRQYLCNREVVVQGMNSQVPAQGLAVSSGFWSSGLLGQRAVEPNRPDFPVLKTSAYLQPPLFESSLSAEAFCASEQDILLAMDIAHLPDAAKQQTTAGGDGELAGAGGNLLARVLNFVAWFCGTTHF